MTNTVAAERAFPTFSRGELRDLHLAVFRNGLRRLTNPDTGLPFTEDEIAAATVEQSRWWIDADGLDLILQPEQQRGLYLADQIRPDRASTAMLRGHHRRLWREEPLPASGGSGEVLCRASIGSIFIGSVTVPDPIATQLRDPTTGKRFQVLFTETATEDAIPPGIPGAIVVVAGIDTGADTNLATDTILEYIANQPLGVVSAEPPKVRLTFRGGRGAETDSEYGARLMDRIARKQAAGNNAHMRHWAREATVAVKDAFVYACAFHAGSTLVCITEKRGSGVTGPAGELPAAGTLVDVISYLTPPGSPVVPRPPHVLVVVPTLQYADLVLGLDMRKGVKTGWTDTTPWPGTGATAATTILTVTDQTHFRIRRPAGSPGLPTGITAPSLMVYDKTLGRFEKLTVTSVTFVSGDDFDVILGATPANTIAVGDYVCPDNGKRLEIAQAIEAYFDSLGPGEVVDLATDDRGHRAARFPSAFEESPQRAGGGLLPYLRDLLGAALANETLHSISSTTPTVPSDPAAGPARMVCGHLGVYAAS